MLRCKSSKYANGTIYVIRQSDFIKECLTKKDKNMSVVKIKPLADRVLVEPQAAEEKTASGIIIPDSAKEKPQKGTVVATGPGTKDDKMEVKVGDTVLYGKYAGTELTLEGKDYLIMRQSDILAAL
jgi:chaperonin GroES